MRFGTKLRKQALFEGGKGGYRSRFTENKTALSQFTKNTTLAFHASREIKENILENHGSRPLGKSRFTRKKRAISHFTGNKNGRSRITKIPFTTLLFDTYLQITEPPFGSLASRSLPQARINNLPLYEFQCFQIDV